MIPSHGGVFEVTVNGKLVFSKKALGRFPEDGEVLGLVGEAPER
jgi:selenoprotein W-related protein